MPSLLGGLLSVAIPYVFPHMSVFEPMIQFRGIILTLLFASVTGAVTGGLMSKLADGTEMASDTHYWEVADDFGKVSVVDAVDLYWMHKTISSGRVHRPSGGDPGVAADAVAAAKDAAMASQALPPPLPDGWRAVQTADGKTYYYNLQTKQTTWIRPSEPAPTAPVDPAPTAPKGSAPAEEELPAGWAELQTLGGHAYYYHKESRSTAWTRPTAEFHRQMEEKAKKAEAKAKAKAKAVPDDVATALGDWVHALHAPPPSADTAVEAAPLPAGWTERQTLGGRAYYYHEESRATAWTRPTAKDAPAHVVTTQAANGGAPMPAGWYELQTLGGRKYYYNKEQKRTVWTRPVAPAAPAGALGA